MTPSRTLRLNRLGLMGLLTVMIGACPALSTAQTIHVADYFLLGARNTWQYTSVTDPAKRFRVVSRRAGPSRFTFTLPFEELSVTGVLGYGAGGNLCIYQLSGSVADLADLPSAVDVDGELRLTRPICLGGPDKTLGEPVVSSVDGQLRVEVSVGPFDKHETARVTGTATTTWSGAEPTATPAGSFDDVVGLTLDVDVRIQADVSNVDVDERITERLSGTLARETGLVTLRRRGDAFVLARAIISRGPVGNLCPSARYLLMPGVQLGGEERKVITVEPHLVTIDGCGPMTAKTQGKATRVDVRANWPSCGDLRRVKLRARLDASTCDSLTGAFITRGIRTDFMAARSRCGDGVFDAGGEMCDVGLGCENGNTCSVRCTCEAGPTSSPGGAFDTPVS